MKLHLALLTLSLVIFSCKTSRNAIDRPQDGSDKVQTVSQELETLLVGKHS